MTVNNKERILLWLPVIIWFSFISLLSSLTGDKLSSISSVILSFLTYSNSHLFKISPDFFLFLEHRIAHTIEYGVLGILVIRAYSHERSKTTVMTILFLACFIFLSGGLDEWHQSFVPGRAAQLIDAIYDTICGTFGMLVYKIFVLNKRK